MLHVDGENGEGEDSAPPLKTSPASGSGAAQQSTQPTTAMAAAMPSALLAKQAAPAPSAPKTAPVAPVAAPATPKAPSKTIMQTTNLMTRLRQNNQAPISAAPAADAVKKMLESIKAVLDGKSPEYMIEIVPVNANESSTKLFASSIIVGTRLAGAPTKAMSYHVLLLGDTADQQNRVDQIALDGGLIIDLPRVVGDAYNDEYRDAVLQVLRATFPDIEQFLEAEASVVPAGYNYKDLPLVQKTLANALTAASSVLNTTIKTDFPDINIPELIELAGGRVDSVAKLQFGQPNTADAVGQPIRSDITVTYSLVTGQQQQQQKRGTIQSLNSGQQQQEIFRVGGYMDLVWRENEAFLGVHQNQYAAPFMSPGQQINQFPYKYQARFVITDTSSQELATLPGFLWGIASSMVLMKNNNWMGAFARSAGASAHHDIGAIGIEVNMNNDPSGFGKPFENTKSATFTSAELHQLLTAYVRPELVFSIDVEECGPSTWQNSIFVAATLNSQANQDIVDAANLLTGGHFGKHFPQGAAVMVNDENRIHLGHFTTNDGRVLDLREIDQLCVLNLLGSTQPDQGRAWSDTFTQLNYDWARRQHERLKIMKLISAGLQVTGFARRVTFRNEFLNALAQGLIDAGLMIRAETPYNDVQASSRGQADFLASATSGYAANTGLFNRGPVAQGGVVGGGMGGASFGRWR